ncbi:MAG TPA: restriction endonuclease subunit S [Fibrobacteraceae bacterium]|nr:restriction endonuclease subunit S [Fibrobacteraceae bacterium]
MTNTAKVTLGERCELVGRGRTPKYGYSEDVKIVNQKCIRWSGLDTSFVRYYDSEWIGKIAKEQYLRKGDVLINSTGEGTIGRACVFDADNGHFIADGHVTVARPQASAIEPYWLRYWIQSEEGQSFVMNHRVGATKQTELSSTKIRMAQIPLPPLPEQKRIVARIQECMERVQEIERLRGETEKEIQSLRFATLQPLGLNQYAECEVGSLILDMRNGRSIKPTGVNSNGSILTLSAVRRISLDFSMQKAIPLDAVTAQKFSFKKDDVFISRANTIDLVGLSGIADKDSDPWMIYPDLLIRVRVDQSKVLPCYFAYALRFPATREQIRSFAKGTSQSMVKISGAEVRKLKIPLPDIPKQRKILAYLKKVEALLIQVTEQQQGQSAESIRQAILRKAFSGEL